MLISVGRDYFTEKGKKYGIRLRGGRMGGAGQERMIEN